MPPESLPWDRKDGFLRERKHERGEAFASAASRWRNSSSTSYSSHYASRDFSRWGSPEFRRPGHGKQGGWHLFEENSGHGCAPSRPCERIFGDETYRPSVSRGDSRYGRSSRDGRGTFTHKEWKSSWEMNNGSANVPGRAHDMHVGHRPVDSMLTSPNSCSDLGSTWDQPQSKVQHDSKESDHNGLNSGRRCVRENSLGSLDWQPLKWTRSGSLSSRGSGFSHSSSSKSLGAVELSEPKHENPLKKATTVQATSGNAPCMTSAPPSEETNSRKKPRLGWGEGLAKYEKKKVEGPDSNANKESETSGISSEVVHSISDLVNKSPKMMGTFNGASPATPSSVVWSSSPGAEDNSSGKAALADNGTSNCISPSIGFENHIEAPPFHLEKLDDTSIDSLGSLLNEFLQCAHPGSSDSSSQRSTMMNKLLVCKGNVLKTLEVTESEIDLLENKLKGFESESGSLSPCPAASSSLPVNDAVKLKEPKAACTSIPQPDPFQIHACVDKMNNLTAAFDTDVGENLVHAKGEEPDSPGTATSKLLEPMSLVKNTSKNLERRIEDSRDTIQVRFVDSVPSSREIYESVGIGGPMLVKDEMVSSAFCDLGSDGKEEDNLLYHKISAFNRQTASQASEVFNYLSSSDGSGKYFGLSNMSGLDDSSLIKQKIAMRRQSLLFKEKILAIKHKIFLNQWREDMQLSSMSKNRAKLHKKFDLGLRASNSCFHKHRTLARSSFSSPDGMVSLIHDGETVNMTSRMISDFQLKPYRESLKMPSLILEDKDKIVSKFISSNGLVEDPCAVEKEKTMINPWTSEERRIFMDNLASYGKDFKKIASFLDHKSTADCVEFYYKNHKSDGFEKMKKIGHSKQANSTASTYMVASGKRWNREIGAASLDILGAVSAMAANRENNSACRSSPLGRIVLGKDRDSISSRVDYAEKRSSITQPVDDDTCSDDSCDETVPGGWTDEERYAFVLAFESHGKNFAKISRCVRTRSQDQCRIFFSKAQKCLGLDSARVSMRVGTSVSNDGNGSDLEDACILESSSVFGHGKLEVKVDENFLDSPSHRNQDSSGQLRSVKLETDLNISEEGHDGIGVSDKNEVVKMASADSREIIVKPDTLLEEVDNAMNGGDSAPSILPVPMVPADAEDKQDPLIAANGVAFPIIAPFTSNSVHSDRDVEISMKEPEQDKSFMPETKLTEKAGNKFDICTFDQESLMKDSNAVNIQGFSAVENSGCLSQVSIESVGRFDHKLDVLMHPLGNRGDSPQILKGYRLQIPTEEKTDEAGAVCGQLSEVKNTLRSDAWTQGFYFRKCTTPNGLRTENSAFSLREQKSGHPRTHTRSLSDTEKTSKSGDVKLFGKILTTHEKEDKGTGHLRQNGKSSSSTLNIVGHQNVNGERSITKHDQNQIGVENVPISYGFWDGNRIQTGFSSLPDSTILLAGYPAAFASYSSSPSKMDLQTSQSLIKSNKHNPNGGLIYPPGAQTFTHGRDVMFSDLRRRNKPELISSLQQQGRGSVGETGGGIFVGGLSHVVSDPVAAIKMHYAKTEQYSGQNGNRGRGEETYNSKREVGR